MGERLARKVLLIGWDAADWKVASPLMDAGLMPTLSRLVQGGVMGNIATLAPVLSPLLWNSIATGVRADRHGILGFVEPDPARVGQVRPVSSTSRKVKALWNILQQRGLRSSVVGWYASHPAEPIDGCVVTNLYAPAAGKLDAPWRVIPGTIHPARLTETLAELRVHPGELEPGHLLPFVPDAARIDQEKDPRLATLAKLVADTTTTHAAATYLLENEPWDFFAVYYDGIDHFGHAFMPYHPPRMPRVSEADFALYSGVVTAAYRFHDMLLERLLQLAGPETTVILVSDHGFHSDHLRPLTRGRGQGLIDGEPVEWHRGHGIVCMSGPHVRKDERIYGATLLDITPTVLTLFGLPVGEDMEGRVLPGAFEAHVRPPEKIPSWEAVPGPCGMHAPDAALDPWEAQAALAQLVDLGYIESPEEAPAGAQGVPTGDVEAEAEGDGATDGDGAALGKEPKEPPVVRIGRDRLYSLARVHIGAGRPELAEPILAELHAAHPDVPRFGLVLGECLFRRRDYAGCRRVVERALDADEERPLVRALLALVDLAEGRTEEALASLAEAERLAPASPWVNVRVGRAYLRTGRPEEAERAFRRATEADPDSALAHEGLAAALNRLERHEDAVLAALRAVGLQHHLPGAHFHLGVALEKLGLTARAIQAFEACLAIDPKRREAHAWLAEIHARVVGGEARAARHRGEAERVSTSAPRSAGPPLPP